VAVGTIVVRPRSVEYRSTPSIITSRPTADAERLPPVSGAAQWRAVIWPPNNSPPIVTRGHVSGVEAIAEALATIDHVLDGHLAA
jgi:hypothetical protein